MTKEVSLKVQEAYTEEAYKGIVRIDSQTMREIGVKAGDIVEITGGRTTVGIVDRAYPSDIGQKIIRMDGIIRRNAKTGIGEAVKISPSDIREAKSITIAPAQQGVMIQAANPEMFRNGLLGRAVMKGDVISLGGARRRRSTMSGSPFEDIFSGIFDGLASSPLGFNSLKFIVAELSPSKPCVITENTNLRIAQKPIEVKENEEKVFEVAYEDIGGLDEEIAKMKEMVELPLRNPEIFESLGITPPKGVLLHGPPGTGKTLLAKAVASETNANFILVNGPELLSKFYGETEKKIRNLFEEAEKNAPSIIFIDEIDAIAPKREETYGEVERRMVSQLLTVMDGLKSRGKVIVIGATNRQNSLDPALRRPGRFDREINIGVPNKEGRLKILKIHTRNMPIEEYDLQCAAKVLKRKLEEYGPQKLEEIKNIKEKIELASKTLSDNQGEIKRLNKELKDLNSEKKTAEEGIISRLTGKIRERNHQISACMEEIKRIVEETEKNNLLIPTLEKRIKLSKSHLTKLKNYPDRLDKIILHLRESTRLKNQRDKEDSRSKIIKNSLDSKEEELLNILTFFEEIDLINDVFYSEVYKESKNKIIDELASKTHGFVGADLESLCKEAAMNVIRREMPKLTPLKKEGSDFSNVPLKLLARDFHAARKIVRPSSLREVLVEAPDVKWSDVGGLGDLKEELAEAIEWPLKNPQSFKKLGIKPAKGILMYGPPGTGKTLLAKAAANESESNFILVKGPELINKWVGESEKGVRKVFERARQTAPTIIFFDEIDALASRRGAPNSSQTTENIVNALLAEMDGLEELEDVVVLAATNRPDLIDPALLRPGRFDRIIATQLPDEQSRLAILKVHTKLIPLAKDVNLETINPKLEEFSGADIQALCREAAMVALRVSREAKEVTLADFEEALKKVMPSLKQEEIKKYKAIEEKYLRDARISQQQPVRQNYMG